VNAVPSFKEQGVELVFGSDRGIVAPKGLPAEIELKLAVAMREVAENPEFQNQMKTQFNEIDYMPGSDWKKHLERADAGFRHIKKKPWTD
jgi:tripartite-type tricarboxylate transporter receptor subunit TctC